MEIDMSWVWVLIPLTAIIAGTFKEVAQARREARRLGVSNNELEAKVTSLEERLDKLATTQRNRLQNLETIVTSRLWNVLHDDRLSDSERDTALARARIEMVDLSQPREPTAEEKAEILAKKLTV